MMPSKLVLQIDATDNVMVALQNLKKGDVVFKNGIAVTLQNDINAKHKFFTKNMQPGDDVTMYGVLVGKAQSHIPVGGLMTTDNSKHAAELYAYRNIKPQWVQPDISKFKNKTFQGYKRSDGRFGTANYWLFIPTVFCENRNLDVIKEALHNELGYAVSDKYKLYTKELISAYKNGISTSAVMPLPHSLQKTNRTEERLFKNVDGI